MDGKETKPKNIAEKVALLVKTAVEECGCTLWDVEMTKEGGARSLIITIDKPGGVSLTDCETVNDAVSPILDLQDPIAGNYYLEISSPGIERELKTPDHIESCVGREVAVKLYAPRDGKKTVSGHIESFDRENSILCILTEKGERISLSRKQCAKIMTVFHF